MGDRPIDFILAEIQANPNGIGHVELCARTGYHPLNVAMAVATLVSLGKVRDGQNAVYPVRRHKASEADD